MDIVTFARLNGVLIDRLIEDGRWHRVPTEDKPKKRNGAYMSRGVYGFVQNHATHTEPVPWKPDEAEVAQVDHAAIARKVKEAAEQIARDQAAAAKRAAWILSQCAVTTHPYLASKGFPEERGNVWTDEKAGDRKLCIPMRADGRLVGLQTISDAMAHKKDDRDIPAFEKKFLYGQRTSEAVYVIDNKGPKIYCEGYATGLSVAAAMHYLRQRFTLVITFTAGNLLKVAKNHGEGFVIGDNDLPSKQHPEAGGHGLEVAKATGLPYWLSDRCPEDFNDYSQRVHVYKASQALKLTFFMKRSAT